MFVLILLRVTVLTTMCVYVCVHPCQKFVQRQQLRKQLRQQRHPSPVCLCRLARLLAAGVCVCEHVALSVRVQYEGVYEL